MSSGAGRVGGFPLTLVEAERRDQERRPPTGHEQPTMLVEGRLALEQADGEPHALKDDGREIGRVGRRIGVGQPVDRLLQLVERRLAHRRPCRASRQFHDIVVTRTEAELRHGDLEGLSQRLPCGSPGRRPPALPAPHGADVPVDQLREPLLCEPPGLAQCTQRMRGSVGSLHGSSMPDATTMPPGMPWSVLCAGHRVRFMEQHHARRIAGLHAARVRHAEPDGPLRSFAATGVVHPDLVPQLRQWIVVYRLVARPVPARLRGVRARGMAAAGRVAGPARSRQLRWARLYPASGHRPRQTRGRWPRGAGVPAPCAGQYPDPSHQAGPAVTMGHRSPQTNGVIERFFHAI